MGCVQSKCRPTVSERAFERQASLQIEQLIKDLEKLKLERENSCNGMLDAKTGEWTFRKLTLRGRKWKYRGEGNANLVIAVPQERKILRLRKCRTMDIKDEETEKAKVLRETTFCQGMMVPLLSKAYIQPPTAACIELDEIRELDATLRSQRPSYRHHKGLGFGYVTIYPDYALLPVHLSSSEQSSPTYCVEVKPKKGWFPCDDRKIPICTFCLKQYWKQETGRIQCRSSYCPLDLFSGNRLRMRRAIKSLLASPQNNLKIFKDGVLVYGEEANNDMTSVLQQWFQHAKHPTSPSRLVENFCHLVLEALTRDMSPEDSSYLSSSDESYNLTGSMLSELSDIERIPSELICDLNDQIKHRCDYSAEGLPRKCILNRILSIQKLDKQGSDSVYGIYKSGQFPDYNYITSMMNSGAGLSAVQRYLLATTVIDCSIMIAFQHGPAKGTTKQHILQDLEKQMYVFNVGVSDLDPKPVSCIEKHCQRDCDTIKACLGVLKKQHGSSNSKVGMHS